MLKSNQAAVQVWMGGEWQYVFCHCIGRIVTTKDRQKALPARYDLEFFQNEFGNNVFRSDKESTE